MRGGGGWGWNESMLKKVNVAGIRGKYVYLQLIEWMRLVREWLRVRGLGLNSEGGMAQMVRG